MTLDDGAKPLRVPKIILFSRYRMVRVSATNIGEDKAYGACCGKSKGLEQQTMASILIPSYLRDGVFKAGNKMY
jgi:hypothetical protein